MRIAFLLTQSLESPSGLGRYWPLAKGLVRLGHQVTILALHHDYASLAHPWFMRDGVEVGYVGQMHVRKQGNAKSYFGTGHLLWVTASSTLQMMRAALRVPADVYHLGKPHPMNGLAALMCRWIRHRAVYLDCDDYEAAINRFAGRWQRWIVACFEDRLPGIAVGITANTRFMVARLIDLGYPAQRIVYVPNGVDHQRFSRTDANAVTVLRQRLGLVNRKVVGYVGSMSLPSHPVDLLLEAFAAVRHREPRVVLLLVGGGEDLETLRRQAQALGLQNSVRFAGRVSPDHIPLYYALADVTADPVHDDAVARARFPLKVVESFASGVPVVTSGVGDRAMLLSSGGGLLVAPGDALALAEGLLAILQDDQVHARFSSEALVASQQYDWDRLVHDFVRVYDRAA